jgi:hypothetical protein
MGIYEIAGLGVIIFQWGLIFALLNRLLRQAGQRPIAPLSDMVEGFRSRSAPLKVEHQKPAPSGKRRITV